MGIVHDALRRDLRRLQQTLATEPSTGRARHLADHITWMMRFLDAHLSAEDAGLYPAVRDANPDAATLLDVMVADHQAIHPAMHVVETVARQWGDSGSVEDRTALRARSTSLQTGCCPTSTERRSRRCPWCPRP